MSDDILSLVPADPQFVPTEASQRQAIEALQQLFPDGETPEAEVHERITFVDCGANLSACVCPACGKRLELEGELLEWWQGVMDVVSTSGVWTAAVEMPCCGAKPVLTSLRFDWPAAFGRFELSIWNPNRAGPLTDAERRSLEAILGCALIEVRSHL